MTQENSNECNVSIKNLFLEMEQKKIEKNRNIRAMVETKLIQLDFEESGTVYSIQGHKTLYCRVIQKGYEPVQVKMFLGNCFEDLYIVSKEDVSTIEPTIRELIKRALS